MTAQGRRVTTSAEIPPCAACGTSDAECRERGGYCCESCRTADTHVVRPTTTAAERALDEYDPPYHGLSETINPALPPWPINSAATKRRVSARASAHENSPYEAGGAP